MQPWMEGLRVPWDGKMWAVTVVYDDGFAHLMRAVVPMETYENAVVHVSDVPALEPNIIRSEN